ncbi:nucleotidyltransferase family protein [Streptococcus sp. NLN64]|uniref:nucleotidyltransferase domain-containing protein n=1 Tax=Streptococcus sp. NLN64 TaxID=2822799 RepID=UPI0018C9100E|nr:nucleotidyltransferase family protein [Streptococcus sp. NLN64]MBG9368168.1 nucleotidyltransferase family protein [Streptococcus sp. NLN64]
MNKQIGLYLVSLLGSVLKGEKPMEKPAELTFEEIYQFAKFHCIEGISFYAIEQLERQPSESLLREWEANRDGNIIKTMNQMAELERLSQLFSQQKIKHMPLKGSVLIHDYPQLDYRYLGDLDILIDPEDAQKVFDLLGQTGYQNIDYGLSNHDTYRMDKGFYRIEVEIHRYLFDQKEPYAPFFQAGITSPSILTDQGDYRYRMSLEDFYLFMVAHFAKHYFKGGSGIRSVMDIFIFLEKYEQQLDWGLVNKGLADLELIDFHQSILAITDAWFQTGKWSEDLNPVADVILTQGAYGTFEHHVENRLKAVHQDHSSPLVASLVYTWKRIFLPSKLIKHKYPYVQKYPILLPLGWAHRLGDAALNRKDRVAYELQLLWKMKK